MIGFIGLGEMGSPMSRRLLAAGHKLGVHDARPEPVALLEAVGARGFKDAAALASEADVVFMMVPTRNVEEVLLGSSGLAEGGRPGIIVIEGGNSDPQQSRRLARELMGSGVQMLDVGFSGGPSGAVTGSLAIMAGGEKSAFRRVEPLLRDLGDELAYLGPSGTGHLAKALNHLIQGLTSQAIGEALAIAEISGLDLDEWLRVVSGGAAASWLIDRAREMLDVDTFEGMDAWWQEHGPRNQLSYAVEVASARGVPVPLACLGHQIRMLSLTPPRTVAMEHYVRLSWSFSHATRSRVPGHS